MFSTDVVNLSSSWLFMLEEVRYSLPGMMVVMHSEEVNFFNTCSRPGR